MTTDDEEINAVLENAKKRICAIIQLCLDFKKEELVLGFLWSDISADLAESKLRRITNRLH